MRFFLIVSVIFFSNFLHASTLTVIGPCQSTPVYKFNFESKAQTLGDLTVQVFKDHQVPYQGDRSGIKSIANSPVGDDALEVLSDTQMRAYGWCVSVNGIEPDRMPDEVSLKGTEDIVWFYAFTLYDRGEWKQICTPAHKLHSLPICH